MVASWKNTLILPVWRLPADNGQLAALDLYVEVKGRQDGNIQYPLILPMLGGSQLTTASLPPWTSMLRLEGGSGAVVILAVHVKKSAESRTFLI
jgi:hypothetical protein